LKGQPQITPIGGPAQGVSHPAAIAAVNGRVFVANADPGGVVTLSLNGEEPLAIACACTPTSLERLAGGATFRLNDAGQGPVWLLDAQSSPPRIVFVPDQERPARGRRPVRRGGVL
jgi:hypothetical protein